MRAVSAFVLGFLMFTLIPATSSEDKIETIQEYNAQLPVWGTAWRPSDGAFGLYYPGFYTGFVMRSQYPERIHVRTSRGNQTRVTVILDENTLGDYLFDLVKRYKEIKKFSADGGMLKIVSEKVAMPQSRYFQQIIESPVYGILDFVARAEAGQETKESIYVKSLQVLEALNPGRIFHLQFDLSAEFLKWKPMVAKILADRPATEVLTQDSKETIIAINTLFFGRLNWTARPSEEQIALLVNAATLATDGSSDEQYLNAALALFNSVRGSKYDMKVVNANGQFEDALLCPSATQCSLAYSEFTGVYATGSADKSTMSDGRGNTINAYTTPGLWQFMSYKTQGRDFDNIRQEEYYGFAPKMDFEGIGNGFHNAAVSMGSPGKSLGETLNIRPNHTRWGPVKRGGVSHGCLRFSIGSVWELRHILPQQNEIATQVLFFGGDSVAFDLFDINGDGKLEVMGVEYMIKYGVKGQSGLDRREGANLEISLDRKLDFYEPLYGSKGVFSVEGNKFVFHDPAISFPSHLDQKKNKKGNRAQKTAKTIFTMEGNFELYEQAYEQDKLQFYVPSKRAGLTEMSNEPISKRLVRLMGRIRGCAPDANKEACGQAAYEKEAKSVFAEATK